MPQRSRGRIPAVAVAVLALALVPSSMTAASRATADALDVALTYLDANAAKHGVGKTDVGSMVVTSSYRSNHNGVTHVNLNQHHEGLEVFGGHVTVSVAAGGNVLHAAGSLVSQLAARAAGDVKLEATDAVEAAARALELDEPEDLAVVSRKPGPAQETVLTGAGISDADIPARLGWQPTGNGLRKAWQLVIDDSSDVHLWKATVDAETGALLDVDDWTSHDHPEDLAATLARPERSFAGALSSPNSVSDGSSYNVFALPKESPNDGPRTSVANPADAFASPFGWHDTDGVAGAEFTITRGNNVHAYLDQDDNNAPDFGDTDGGAGLTFDFAADLNEHAQNYRDAVVTNLFYWNNVIHDVMHQYGFNEPSGNFQASNYGRGGVGSDYVRAEAADGGGTNNANFSTPAADGGVPRMQMYLWPGDQFGPQNQVVVDGLGEFNASWSRFSLAPSVAGTSGPIVDAGNGCNAAAYSGAPADTDWIAIVTGANTGCQNIEKARQAGAAGAKALIVANTGAAAPILAGAAGSMATATPAIPVASINLAAGNAIRAAVAAGETTGTVRKHPDHPGIRDGDFENGIVIHEYGHGVSLRLTGGPGINCLGGDEQGGEGWSDYLAIVMLIDPALDDPEGPRGMGPYALFQDSREGAGIRPRPYSRNMSIQPFTYDSIRSGGWLNGTSLAVPHGVGHGWAAILWDLTWDLIDKHGFNPDVYGAWSSGGNNRSLQYVVDGLKLQGCNPGFVAARNGIIAATEALGGEDTCTVWASFARRGLGYSAVQGSTARDDNSEAFDTHPDCRVAFANRSAAPQVNVVNSVGSTVSLVFPGGGSGDLASSTPYSRQVDCTTLATVVPGQQFITPRPLPVPTQTAGSSGLSYDQASDRYTYPWQTDREWAGSCREVVVTRENGVQHRAYFRFDGQPSHPVSGTVRGPDGQPAAGAQVTIGGTPLSPAITDANGFYSFPAVPRGTYSMTVAGSGGCVGTVTRELVVSRPTTANVSLPLRRDGYGYSCELVALAFEEAANATSISGDDTAGTIALPFAFTFYGQPYTQARVCTNGFVEFIGPATASCPFTNTALPTTARPNGAIYPYWDDLFVDAAASIRTETKGEAPNRRFVIEFRNPRFFSPATRRVDFNVVLHENGEIVTQTRNLADDPLERGASATIGIEDHTGTVALQFSFNEAVLAAEPAVTSIRYLPPQTVPVSGVVREADDTPAAGVTVSLERPAFSLTATTDAAGAYSFPAVPEGTYTATASAGACRAQTKAAVVSGPTTLDFTLGDQSDSFGYSCRLEDAAFDEAADVTGIAGDDVAGVVDLPFAFTFYGQTHTQAYVCTNGYVEFVGPATSSCAFGNTAIPAAARPNGAIYSFWDDLLVDAAASIRTELKGAAPNRRFVIEFRNAHFFADTTRRVDFNVVLHENGQIQTQARNLADDGRERGNSATLGIENHAGTVALQFSFNQAALAAQPAVTTIRYRPPGS